MGRPPAFVDRLVQVHIVFTSWDEADATVSYPWHQPYGTFGSDPLAYDYASGAAGACWFTSQTGVWKSIDLTSAVKDWHEGNNENLGVVLWATNAAS